MNELDPATASPVAPVRPWHVSIDTRDVMGVVGGGLVLTGAYALDWKAAVAVAGAALLALAWRLNL